MTAYASKTSLIRKSLTAVALAGAFAASMVAGSSSAQAFPKMFPPHPHHFWGPGLGIGLGLGLLGAAAAADSATTCVLERQYDRYGNYVGRVRVCE